MTPLKYENLSDEEIDFIADGCGSKSGLIDVPDFVYRDSCQKHDVMYWRGGTEKDRKKADEEFYRDMMDDASDASWFLRAFYKSLAWVYYQSVRLFSKSFFHYADKPRTYEDLVRAMEEADVT